MILQKNDSIVFKLYIACCLVFVWSSIFLTLGFFALMVLFGISSSLETSVV